MPGPLAKTSMRRERFDHEGMSPELIFADHCERGRNWRLSQSEYRERESVQRSLTRPGLAETAPDKKRDERDRDHIDFESGHREADLVAFAIIQPVLVIRIADEVGNNDLRPGELFFGKLRHHNELRV